MEGSTYNITAVSVGNPHAVIFLDDVKSLNLERLERKAIERAMRQSKGNVTYAAELLGITRFSLYRKMEKLGL